VTKIWAHRGSRTRAPENTLAAFDLSVEEGADGIELDVHLTSDGHLVVRHDAEVVLPEGEVARIGGLTLEDLRHVDVGGVWGFHGVPTLEEVYDLLAPTGVELNVEAKSADAYYEGIEDALIATRDASGMADRVVFSSFNHYTLRNLRQRDPEARVAALYGDGLVDPWRYLKGAGFDEVHPFYPNLLIPGAIEGLLDAGIAVRPWTVNEMDLWIRFIEAGIDGIITDLPGDAVETRDAVLGD